MLEGEKRGIPVHYTINDEHPRQFRYTTEIKGLKDLARRSLEEFYTSATFRKLQKVKLAVISHALKKNLLNQRAPVDTAKVIYQGVDLEMFPCKPLKRGQDEPLKLLYVGQLSKVKGVHTLLKAMTKLEGPSQLTIVGTGVPEYVNQLKQFVRDNDLSRRVRFAGKLSHSEVVKAYSAHHILCFTSEWEEPFGLTHLEAMASGCAVVSTTTGGSAELIRHNLNALAFQAGSSDSLALAITRLQFDEKLRKQLQIQGREYVEKFHSLKTYVESLESWLKEPLCQK